MSPRRRGTEEPDAREDQKVSRTDGTAVLSRNETFQVLFLDPAVRNYTIAALSSLAMIFLILFQQGSDLGGFLIVVFGVMGVLLRWTAAPAFILFTLLYFMVFPFGVPGEAFENRWEIEDGRFRPVDIILAMAVLVYVASQFRILGFVHQAVAYEGAAKRPDEPATRRPPALIGPSELLMFLGVAFGLVIAAQVVWMLLNSIEIAPGEELPLRWAESRRSFRRFEPVAALSPGTTRFMLLVGLLAFGVALGRLVFGYWRLRMMGAAEGGMILLDGGWSETKRERSRQEKWRIWGRKRAEAQAKAESAAIEKLVNRIISEQEKHQARRGRGKR